MSRLAIILSHPIQYYAPWFRHLSHQPGLDLKVFYLWDFGVTAQKDIAFQTTVSWDIPLLEGYAHEFVPNRSKQPGTSHLRGLDNPSLTTRVSAYRPDAVLMMNYNYLSCYQFLWQWSATPLLFKGDSHVLQVPQGIKPWIKRRWISAVYSRFSACLYVGQANRQYFEYHGVPADRLFFAPHAVENQRFIEAETEVETQAWKRDLGIPLDHQVILFAGKLIEKKRPLDLIAAFRQAQLPKTALLFVGSGPLEKSLRSAATDLPNVYFAPFQNQSQMPRTYAIASVFVLPSYGAGETWGLAVNEVMCLAKPVIVSDHVGCAADLVQPGGNGWVFTSGNVSQLSEILTQAIGQPERLIQYGQRSREIVSNYSYKQATEGLQMALSHLRMEAKPTLSQTRSQTRHTHTT